jgi:hypothetical protein
MMKIDFSVEETVKARMSVRSYQDSDVPTVVKEQIKTYIASLSNPFSIDVSFRLLEKATSANGEKLGTYGVIKGASDFIGVSVAPGNLSLEALGYSFEQLILYITSLGLGTCWLGGTFDRSGFKEAMKLSEGDWFPVISPFGIGKGKRRMMDSAARWLIKADQRLDWNQLFFKDDFSKPLTQEQAGEYAFPLEMLRLAPSAANKQPWRIVCQGGNYHFYEARSMKDGKSGIDIQKTDVGICACHFHLAAKERNMQGHFAQMGTTGIQTPDRVNYLFSWITDDNI